MFENGKKMAAMCFQQVQRFILAKKIFWGSGHFNGLVKNVTGHQRDAYIGPVIFTIFRTPFSPIALEFCLALRCVAY